MRRNVQMSNTQRRTQNARKIRENTRAHTRRWLLPYDSRLATTRPRVAWYLGSGSSGSLQSASAARQMPASAVRAVSCLALSASDVNFHAHNPKTHFRAVVRASFKARVSMCAEVCGSAFESVCNVRSPIVFKHV